jgi:cell division protein FtsB
MKKNNLELEKLKVESKDLHEKIEDLRSKNIKLKRMVNNLNYDLVKSTKM